MPQRLVANLLHKPFLLAGGVVFGWFAVEFIPNPMLIFFLVGSMVLDLITGLMKSWATGKKTSSTGFRQTVRKFILYFSAISATWLLANLLSQAYHGINYTAMVNWVIGFLSLIELYSVFENVYAASPNSMMSRFLAKPLLFALGGLLEKGKEKIAGFAKSLPDSDTSNTTSNEKGDTGADAADKND